MYTVPQVVRPFFENHAPGRDEINCQKPWTKILLVVNVGSLEKRSNQPKYKYKNEKSKDYCKADLRAAMASRNIVKKTNNNNNKNNTRCFKSALE